MKRFIEVEIRGTNRILSLNVDYIAAIAEDDEGAILVLSRDSEISILLNRNLVLIKESYANIKSGIGMNSPAVVLPRRT